MEEELLYTQEDIDEWMRTCDNLQEHLSEQRKNIKDLEQQLIEKDKEIKELKAKLKTTELYNESKSRPYAELEGKSLYEISQIYQNQVRRQICDEIRQAFNKEDFWLYGDNNKIISLHEDEFNNIINKIEKGE